MEDRALMFALGEVITTVDKMRGRTETRLSGFEAAPRASVHTGTVFLFDRCSCLSENKT